MKLAKPTIFQRRRICASILLAIFLTWLPLSAFPIGCCCSESQDNAPVEMTCHQSVDTAEVPPEGCHSFATHQESELVINTTPSCCSATQQEDIRQVSLNQDAHQCKTECGSTDISEPSGIIVSNQTEAEIAAMAPTCRNSNHQAGSYRLNRLFYSGNAPPMPHSPLFLINSSFLI